MEEEEGERKMEICNKLFTYIFVLYVGFGLFSICTIRVRRYWQFHHLLWFEFALCLLISSSYLLCKTKSTYKNVLSFFSAYFDVKARNNIKLHLNISLQSQEHEYMQDCHYVQENISVIFPFVREIFVLT